ncbi:intercellular adhesion molecule 5 isoform X2 [Carassius gibelio]|uniref:intercellular adhesion molecule 5 isoform X2 n=1 Tax=Carassius gibelio TaxID=101364 RepID=UPI0022791A3E|nr:intercellular adhesion molecule 5 isoform X2 [Carassius gibelio]
MLLLQPLIGLLLISLAHGDCPILFSPVYVVVEYGKSFSVNCSSTGETDQFGLSWEKSNETIENNEDIFISVNVTDWERTLTCYMYSNEALCSQNLPVTIYKTPDNVSISIVNHRGPMIAGQQYELQCDVHDVAPVTELTVKWYKGQTLLDQTTFTEDSKTPVNVNPSLLIRPDRDDDGAQYWCEAELDLGEDGPQYPTKSLEALSAEVHYKPKHSSSTETIIQKDEVTLNCTVKANPAPVYIWYSDHLKEEISSSVLQSSTLSPGNYTCNATNSLGTDTKVFIIKSENQCPVQLNPQRAVVRYNGSVAVHCSALVSHKGIGWEASEGAVPKTSNNLITWRVSHLTEWEIQPFCFINYERQCDVKLPVIIYKTPDNVSISIVNHTGPMIEGRQYQLQCDVHDVAPVQYLAVKWYKGQTLLNQITFTEDSKTPVNVNPTLLIRPDRADDGAQYRCEAELDLGAEGPQPPPKETSDPLYITVHYAPNIQFCNSWSPLTGTSLDSYPLNVNSVLGNPRPIISWRHKASSVNSYLPLTKFDSGQYEIIASNVLSNFSCSINITVEYPPELNCSENYEVKEKTLFQFPCIADGSPKPKLSLRKNGNIIQHELFFPNWTHSGQYQVIAENQRGTINSTVTINILHAPMIYVRQDKFVVGKGGNLKLNCTSTGNPEPKMWLSFNNKNISTGGRNITLKIERATSKNDGIYTCSAINVFGRNDKSFVVEIRDDSLNYFAIVALVLGLLVFFLILVVIVLLLMRNKRGHYDLQSVKQYEMQPLGNGGPA